MRSESAATGIVLSVSHGTAEVAVQVAGCSGCGRQSACGIGKLAGSARTVRLRVPDAHGLCPGDTVHLNLPADGITRAALFGYLVPAILMIAGAAIGDALFPGTAGGPVGLLIGLAVGVLATRFVPQEALGVTRS